MSGSIVKLSVLLSANASQATTTLRDFANAAHASSMKAKQAFNGQSMRVDASGLSSEAVRAKSDGILSSIGGVRMALSGAVASAGIYAATMSLKLASANEQATVSFETLLKSAAGARKMIDDLQQLAKVTPFGFSDIRSAAQQMLSYGIAARDVIPMLRIIGDAASTSPQGMAEGMERVTRAIGQMKGRGKVSSQEMLQLTEAGINAWEMLARGIGKSVAETMTLVENGSVNAATGIKALLEGMQKQMGGNMDKQAGTLAGKMSNLWDSLKIFAADTGEMGAGLFKLGDGIDWLTKKFDGMNNTVRSAKAGFDVTDPIAKLQQAQKMAADQFLTNHKVGRLSGDVEATLNGDWWKKNKEYAAEMEQLIQKNLKALGSMSKGAVKDLDIVKGDVSPAVAEFEKLRKELQLEVSEFGMTAEAKKIKHLQSQGGTPEMIRELQMLQQQRQAMEERKKMFDDGAKLVEDMRTPYEALNHEVDNLNKHLQAGSIDWQTYERAVGKANDKFREHEPLAKLLTATYKDLSDRIEKATMTESQLMQKRVKDAGGGFFAQVQVEAMQNLALQAEAQRKLAEEAEAANKGQLTGIAKYGAELKHIKDLWDTDKLTPEARDGMLQKAKKDAMDDLKKKNEITNPGLALAGSQEAYKAMVASTQVSPQKSEELKLIASMEAQAREQTKEIKGQSMTVKELMTFIRNNPGLGEKTQKPPVVAVITGYQ